MLALSNDGVYSHEDLHRIYYFMRYSTICCLGASTSLSSPSTAISEELRIIYRKKFNIGNILTELEILASIKPQGIISPITHVEDHENLEKYQTSGLSKDSLGFRPIELDETDLDDRVNKTIRDMIVHFSSPPSQEEIRIVENKVWRYKIGSHGLPGGLLGLAIFYFGLHYLIKQREYKSSIKQI